MRNILISNDDGIYGPGLRPLIRALRPLGRVTVCVPDGERSAASHSITLHKPFRVQTLPVELGRKETLHAYITNGTPADCVRFGVLELMKGKKADLIVGGINHGPNLGEDIYYSGTVAIARESIMNNIPAFAISVIDGKRALFDSAARVACRIARSLLQNKLAPNIFLNVNVPDCNSKTPPFEITRLGKRVYGKEIPSGIDPRGHLFYWLAGDVPRGINIPGTDIAAVKARRVSITPLSLDCTHLETMAELSRRKF